MLHLAHLSTLYSLFSHRNNPAQFTDLLLVYKFLAQYHSAAYPSYAQYSISLFREKKSHAEFSLWPVGEKELRACQCTEYIKLKDRGHKIYSYYDNTNISSLVHVRSIACWRRSGLERCGLLVPGVSESSQIITSASMTW